MQADKLKPLINKIKLENLDEDALIENVREKVTPYFCSSSYYGMVSRTVKETINQLKSYKE